MITNIILHHVGSKLHDEGVGFANNELELTEEKRELLEHFFLSQIANKNETYRFYTDANNLNCNPIYECVSKIFENPQEFKEQSKNIGAYLYKEALHPMVKGGELFIVKIKDDLDVFGEAIGIFKIENQDTFFKIKGGFDASLDVDKGVAKIAKCAIIFNDDKESGYVVKIVENNDKLSYWKDDFLQVKERDDEFFNTKQMLSIYKNFITEELPEEFEVTKIDQADLLNKSINYFTENQSFDFEHFTNSVLQDDELIESFSNYKEDYEHQNIITISDEFAIDNNAVKKGKRSYKSVIKLDKNFHIYIHGDRELIEQGEDKKGKFYKIYFKEEN